MSLTAIWMLANAELISTTSTSELWRLNDDITQNELRLNSSCIQLERYRSEVWCMTPESLWMVTSLAHRHYARRFNLPLTPVAELKIRGWFGEGTRGLKIDGQRLEFYLSQHSADALVRGYRLRQSMNIKFYKELKHGRYHLVTTSPAADIFVVQQATGTTTIVISATGTESH